MSAARAVEDARSAIERLATARFRPDLDELQPLYSQHRYFSVYALGRTAPVGGGPHLAHALLALFPPALVTKAFGWVQDVGGLRRSFREACVAAADRLYGDLSGAEELADRLEDLVALMDFSDRPIAGAWADLAPPDGVGARIEHAATILREYRGNGHISVLTAHGLTGVEALLLSAAWRDDDDPTSNARFFGWRDDDLEAGWARLQATGRVDERRAITEDGREERSAIEELTAALASPPWAALPGEDRQRTVRLLDQARSELEARS